VHGVLITGGESPEREFIETVLKRADLIIAADSGLNAALKMGVRPGIVVGDMDSIRMEIPRDIEVITFQKEKDETDTEIGLRILAERGATHRCIIGGGGGRLDHLLGIVSLFHRESAPDEWYTRWEHIIQVKGMLRLTGLTGKRISLFPLGCQICRMESEGLQWPLNSLSWKQGSMGISNIVTKDPVRITMKKGRLLLIYDLCRNERP
jgi:thiamine pyrophosphokinase